MVQGASFYIETLAPCTIFCTRKINFRISDYTDEIKCNSIRVPLLGM